MTPTDRQNALWPNVGADVAYLCEYAEDLCREVAPQDLAGLPLYIVPQSAVQATLGDAKAIWGFTMNALDLVLRDQLAWRGRGPCVAINDVAMQEDLGSDFREAFLGTVLHELAHVFERGMTYGPSEIDFSPERVKFEQLVIAQAMSEPVPQVEQPRHFLAHSDRFMRIAFHLLRRAELCGEWLPRPLLVPSEKNMRWSIHNYRDALGDEPDLLRNQSIQSILAMEPPTTFTTMWAAERNHYHSLEVQV